MNYYIKNIIFYVFIKKKKSAADDIHVHEFLETLPEPGQSISVSIFKVLNHYSGSMVLKQLSAIWLPRSKPLLCPEYWGASAFDCHSHTHSLFISTSDLTFSLPGFNMLSFILHFSEDSIYLLYIFHWHIFKPFSLFLSAPFATPFAVPLPLKQSSFFLSLFIYMTPRFSLRQVRMAKGRLLQNGSGLISSPCFSSQPKSFIAELTVLS